MTRNSTDPGPLRLNVLALLADYDAAASGEADSWVHAGGMPFSDTEADLIGSATMPEWELAGALRAGPGEAPDHGELEVAALLRLAAGAPGLDALLGTGLRQAFLLPGDSAPAVARGERIAAFADLYRRLALPGLPAGGMKQAGSLLGALSSRAEGSA